jgi:hypothetical protein
MAPEWQHLGRLPSGGFLPRNLPVGFQALVAVRRRGNGEDLGGKQAVGFQEFDRQNQALPL